MDNFNERDLSGYQNLQDQHNYVVMFLHCMLVGVFLVVRVQLDASGSEGCIISGANRCI